MSQAPLFFLVAGEPSGDVLGGRLMAALRRRLGAEVRFAGIGGPQMIGQGLVSRFPMSELSLMGVAEILPHLPRLIRRIGETAKAVVESRPAALITIDAPAFNLRLGRRLAGTGIKRIHYVAPQHWAWRPGRAAKLAGQVDLLLGLLPFEPEFFARYGVDCRFVGHPVLESAAGKGDASAFRAGHGLGEKQPLLCLLPGSRRGEVTRLLPGFLETARLLAARIPDLALVIPTVPHVEPMLRAAVEGMTPAPLVITGEALKYDAFAAADAALAASGTVALELALSRTPSVIAYRMNPISAFLAYRLVTVPHASLPNIILDRRMMPEFLQKEASPAALSAALEPLLTGGQARLEQMIGVERVAEALGAGGRLPSDRAAAAILESVGL